jgi:hypothetical protein
LEQREVEDRRGGARVTDEIVLTLPRERRFYDVAHLVVSGLAARLNLTVENLADLQLALAGLLPRRESGGDVTVALAIDGEHLEGRIGPFEADVATELERVGAAGVGTHHVLAAVFDSYRVAVEDGAAWVHFTKVVTLLEKEA